MRNPAPPRDSAAAEVFQVLVAPGGGPQDIEQNVELLRQFRAASPEGGAHVDRMVMVIVPGAFTSERHRNGAPDPARCARDQHLLILEWSALWCTHCSKPVYR